MKEIFKVDKEKCVKCGVCSEVCPVKIIEFEKGSILKNVGWAKKVCINCGHCVAVCPAGALSLNTMPVEECALIKDELNINKEQVEQLLKSRRSIRIYKDKPVSKESIEDLIGIARYAPSGHNFQPVKWKVIYAKNKVVKLKDMVIMWMKDSVENNEELAKRFYMANIVKGCELGFDLILREAPHVIVAYASKEDRTADNSCRLAMAYLELAASNAGLGTCWGGYLDLALSVCPPIQKELDLPEGNVSYASMMLGHPKYNYRRIPLRKTPQIDWA